MAASPVIRLAGFVASRPECSVREERLQTTARLPGTPAIALSAWRGRSGRRYVVGIHACSCPDLVEHDDAVLLAVRRDAEDLAHPVAVASCPGCSIPEWIAACVRQGATEIHVHRLAVDYAERLAVVADISPVSTNEVA